jgi:hypothetical protein
MTWYRRRILPSRGHAAAIGTRRRNDMYITLAWSAHPPTDPVDVEAEIYAAIEALAFENIFNAHDNVFLANIRRNFDRQQVQLLHNALRGPCVGRYSYVITVSPTAWDLAPSPDLDQGALATIVAYQT